MTDAARDAARSVRRSPVARILARGGYAANGVVHLVFGVVVIVISFGGRGESDQIGVFTALLAAPAGLVLVWVLGLLLAALGVFQALRSMLVKGTDAAAWGRRGSAVGQAVVYLALAAIAVSVALGARPDGDRSAQQITGTLFATPGGVFVVAAAGGGLVIGGLVFASIGARRSFDTQVRIPHGRMGAAVSASGVIGYLGKGVSVVILGVLLIVATVKQEPEAAGGFDAAIKALLDQTIGPALVFLIGLGLIVYAVFCFLRTRYAKL
ncbi:DUF1206 domain-containing protein [Microbacterium dauci]|uniref:DUF1206 domain-containing protein n=1 Tax=Microbacterium dauci TaxID=3048008 RepID=A0ABT6ZA91_9MICO|nr:DUF1206 domain-containing protein [Microbacterium sp. LX3-4]MDJ1113069.1 DUF1206 domain-containing protein [Microbacterium sp. LX3-4]